MGPLVMPEANYNGRSLEFCQEPLLKGRVQLYRPDRSSRTRRKVTRQNLTSYNAGTRYGIGINTFIYYFLLFFNGDERKKETESRDTGSSSKSRTQIEFHETHSALWRVTAKSSLRSKVDPS